MDDNISNPYNGTVQDHPTALETLLRIDTHFYIKLNLRQVYINEHLIQLTRKEYELLLLLVTNRDRILTREYLMLQLWSDSVGLRTRTLDTHIKVIRSKLQPYGTQIKTLHCIGYIFIGGNPDDEL